MCPKRHRSYRITVELYIQFNSAIFYHFYGLKLGYLFFVFTLGLSSRLFFLFQKFNPSTLKYFHILFCSLQLSRNSFFHLILSLCKIPIFQKICCFVIESFNRLILMFRQFFYPSLQRVGIKCYVTFFSMKKREKENKASKTFSEFGIHRSEKRT